MTIQEANTYFHHHCDSLFGKNEGEEIFNRLIEELTSKTTFELKLDKQLVIDEEKFNGVVAQLLTNRPLQYVLGYEWFYNLKLKVNEQVLIPRPETDELVRWVLDTIKKEKLRSPRILDVGTGSGCIPVVLKNEMPGADVTAIDISEAALEVAKENAATYDLTIDFIRGDILEKNFSIEKTFDLIISNPPYITAAEKKDMHERVLAFEPKEALFVTNHDPLQFYKAILTFSKHHLSPDGKIFLELNRDYGIQTQQLYDEAGFETELRKDMYGNTRMLMAQKKPTDFHQ